MKKTILFAFAIIYITFILLDICGFYIVSNYVKLSSTCLAFALALMGKNGHIKLGLALTLVCDFVLLFTNCFSFGIALFCVVHLIYIHMQLNKSALSQASKNTIFLNHIKKGKALWLIPLAVPFFVFPVGIFPISIVYAGLISSNIFLALKNKNKLPIAAFALFALCDICVVVYNFTESSFFLFLIWIFYSPSQLILSGM